MKFTLIGLVLIFMSCKDYPSNKQVNDVVKDYNDSLSTIKLNKDIKLNKLDSTSYSFVLSCGSGCALTYDLVKNQKLNDDLLELVFHITMYTNDEVVDNYVETYRIKYSNNKVYKIYFNDDREKLLEKDSPNLFFEIKKLSDILNRTKL